MALVEMSLGAWMVLGLKAGCALALAMIITDVVRGILMEFIDAIFGRNDR